MRFPSGALATCSTSYGADLEGFVRVHGSKGTFTLQPAFSYEEIQMVGQIDVKRLPVWTTCRSQTSSSARPNTFQAAFLKIGSPVRPVRRGCAIWNGSIESTSPPQL